MAKGRASLLLIIVFCVGLAINLLLGFLCSRWFANLGLDALVAGIYSVFTLTCLQMLLLPSLVLAFDANKGWIYAICLLVSSIVAGFFYCGKPLVLTSHLVVVSFVLLIYAASEIAGLISRRVIPSSGFLLTIFMFTSFYWSGLLIDLPSGSEIAVWLSPQAVITAAFPGFSFAHLPEVYRIWLGPVAPIPSSFMDACLYYAVPAIMLLIVVAAVKFILSKNNNK